MMKLWLLLSRDDLPRAENPFENPDYDKSNGHIVRAATETEARALADEAGGDENDHDRHPWLDAAFTICDELSADGPAEVILTDFHAA